MSKELPYFKFYPNEWSNGDITLESMTLQGIFVNVCSTYWSKDCQIEVAKLKARYGKAIATLLEKGLIKENEGFCVIGFLDEQWDELSKYHKNNVENGKKGAAKRWPSHSPAISPPIALRREEKKGEEKKGDNKRFTPPSIELIKEYCIERKNSVSAEKFLDHYTSNGWKVGRNPMKDWKAAVRTWEKSSFDKPLTHNKNNTIATADDLNTEKL